MGVLGSLQDDESKRCRAASKFKPESGGGLSSLSLKVVGGLSLTNRPSPATEYRQLRFDSRERPSRVAENCYNNNKLS